MENFIKELHKLNNHEVRIITLHEWFGKQKYKCLFNLINDEKKIGFKIKNHEIFLLKTEVEFFEHTDKSFFLKDSLMFIEINAA